MVGDTWENTSMTITFRSFVRAIAICRSILSASSAAGVLRIGAVVMAVLWGLASAASGQGLVRLRMIDKLPDSTNTVPVALNWNGTIVVGYQVVNTAAGGPREVPFTWPGAGGTAEPLPVPAGIINPEPAAMDATGQIIVGSCLTPGQPRHGCRWSFRVFEDLGPSPSGFDWGLITLDKEGNTAFGYMFMDQQGQTSHLIRWSILNGIEDLGVASGDAQELPIAGSGDGKVAVGWAHLPIDDSFPLRWASSGFMHLPNMPRPPDQQGGNYGFATACNFVGSDIVGQSNGQSFRWKAPGTLTPMPLPPGGELATPMAMSADGYRVCGGANGRAIFWAGDAAPVELNEFLPAHGVPLTGWSRLQQAMVISGDGYVMAGVGVTAANEFGRGFVADLKVDSDGDGLYDDWETDGIPYLDASGNPQRYHLEGANPLRKDVYVEIDAHSGFAPSQTTIDRVIAAFNSAPVPAVIGLPGGLPGITLHATVDETNLPSHAYVHDDWSEYQADKAAHFGTVAERADAANWPAIKVAKAMAYRYGIFATTIVGAYGEGELDTLGSQIYGPRIGGNDFKIGLQGYQPPPGSTLEDFQAACFMHELGHTLGLFHGGGSSRQNYNPNHYSVMNYLWVGARKFGPNAPTSNLNLNYADHALPFLDESALDESVGIRGNLQMQIPIAVRAPGAPGDCNGHSASGGKCFMQGPYVPNTCMNFVPFSGPVDWNNDGVISPSSHTVCADPNALNEPSPGGAAISVNEWSLLAYNFRDSPGYDDLAILGPNPDPCPTLETEMFLASLPPPPPLCVTAIAPGSAQPSTGKLCAFASAATEIAPQSEGPFMVHWQRRDDTQNPPAWMDLADGVLPGGTMIDGSQEGTLNITSAAPNDLGQGTLRLRYRLTDLCGNTATSGESTRTIVQVGLSVTTPTSVVLCPGGSASFAVQVAGATVPPTFRWRVVSSSQVLSDGTLPNGTVVSGATTAAISLANIQRADFGAETFALVCTAQTECEPIDSAPFVVSTAGVIITAQPADVVLPCAASQAVFTIQAAGPSSLTYRWSRNRVPLTDGGRISGAATPTLTISSPQSADAGRYECIATAPCGSATSSEARLDVGSPTIVQDPPLVSPVCPNAAAFFITDAFGTPPIEYQWFKDSVPLDDDNDHRQGSHTAFLSIGPAYPDDLGAYTLHASNACGTFVSQPAILAAVPPLVFQDQPHDVRTCPGGTAIVSLTVAQSGVSYSWFMEDPTTPDSFAQLSDGPLPLPVGSSCGNASGTATSQLHISWSGLGVCGPSVRVVCVISNPCTQVVSDFAHVSLCDVDIDCSGIVSVADIFSFLSSWFEGSPAGDFNHSGQTEIQDIFAFLAAWFSGC